MRRSGVHLLDKGAKGQTGVDEGHVKVLRKVGTRSTKESQVISMAPL